jgi:hypothetical protein
MNSTKNDSPHIRFAAMSKEAQEAAVNMIYYCVENGLCMGMDYGLKKDDKPRSFRKHLENFCLYEES